jgi:HYR domain
LSFRATEITIGGAVLKYGFAGRAFVIAAAVVAMTVPSTVGAAATLPLHAEFQTSWSTVGCPAGTPVPSLCNPVDGSAPVPGLGSVAEHYLVVSENENTSCPDAHFDPVFTVAGKGTISFAVRTPPCVPFDLETRPVGTLTFTVTGGSGMYAGASGGGTLLSTGSGGNGSGVRRDEWTGTVVVPGAASFDLVPPTFAGVRNLVVHVRRHVKRVAVSYTVTASDNVDGAVSPTCDPPPGSRFRLGRTTVTCTATDSSGNTSTATFVVSVKRRHARVL